MRKVSNWFSNSAFKAPPESIGYWGELCDEFYRYQQRHEQMNNQLRADIAYLRDSFASLTDAVVMVDKSGCIEWCNAAAAHILGFRLPRDHGQIITHLFREPSFVQFFESRDYSQPIKVYAPVSQDIILKVQISTFGQGNRLVFARDITEISKLEEVRQDFVSNVSHELRTPLTVLMGYIDNFHIFEDKVPQIKKPLEQMGQQGARMSRLITDLLDLSRLETLPNEQHKTRVDMADLARIVVSEAKASLVVESKLHDIHLIIEQPLVLFGQETELHSALLNLVINACKYTLNKGTIIVTCGLEGRGGYFSVKDNGVGVDETQVSRLTERFYRVDKSRSINTGGTGLGLAIVKRVLIRHESTLEIKSEVGKGSEFICHFPRHRISTMTQ